MKQKWSNLAEAALLFAALFLSLPYVPSHEAEALDLLPGAALALLLFAGSRYLRWRTHRWVVLETASFAAFLWGSNAVANILHAG